MGEMWKSVILYIADKNYGYYSDLVDKFGQEMVDEFCSVGFIKTGFTRERKTWSCLDLAHSFKNDLELDLV